MIRNSIPNKFDKSQTIHALNLFSNFNKKIDSIEKIKAPFTLKKF